MTYHQASWLISINKYVIGNFYSGKYVSDLIVVPVNLNQDNITSHYDFEEMEFDVIVMLEHENISLKEARKTILIPFFDFFKPEKILKE